jgi:UDP-glucose 4-epimerase
VRVLVTGAAGFVGGIVADQLAAAGHQVTALVRDEGVGPPPLDARVAIVTADLLTPPELTAAGVEEGYEAVCHLAALTRVRESVGDPLRYHEVNVAGTLNLLLALERGTRRHGIAPVVVFGSSCAVYGAGELTPIPESAPTAPLHPYGASKLSAERLVLDQARTGRIGAVVLRAFNVAGATPGHADPDRSRIVPAALEVVAGLRDVFGINGDGGTVREYVHVADMADAYRAALEAVEPGETRVYNVGSGIGVSITEVLDAVERVTGRTVARVRRPAVAEARVLVADSSLIRAELGWRSDRSRIDRIVADAWAEMTGSAAWRDATPVSP